MSGSLSSHKVSLSPRLPMPVSTRGLASCGSSGARVEGLTALCITRGTRAVPTVRVPRRARPLLVSHTRQPAPLAPSLDHTHCPMPYELCSRIRSIQPTRSNYREHGAPSAEHMVEPRIWRPARTGHRQVPFPMRCHRRLLTPTLRLPLLRMTALLARRVPVGLLWAAGTEEAEPKSWWHLATRT